MLSFSIVILFIFLSLTGSCSYLSIFLIARVIAFKHQSISCSGNVYALPDFLASFFHQIISIVPRLGSNRFFTLSNFSSVEFILTSTKKTPRVSPDPSSIVFSFFYFFFYWCRARHMLTISLIEPIGSMIGYDITSNCRCARPFVSKLWQRPCLWSFIFLLPSSKPLDSRAQLTPLKLDQRSEWGKNLFIKNHGTKWPTSFTNTVWTGDSNCKLVPGPTTAAPSDN